MTHTRWLPWAAQEGQDRLGKLGRRVLKRSNSEVWTRPLAGDAVAIALSNVGSDTAGRSWKNEGEFPRRPGEDGYQAPTLTAGNSLGVTKASARRCLPDAFFRQRDFALCEEWQPRCPVCSMTTRLPLPALVTRSRCSHQELWREINPADVRNTTPAYLKVDSGNRFFHNR